MDGIDFIQDLATVLLAAGIAGALCKRVGLSVIVGYLMAGVFIGPYTPPFSLIIDVDRIQMLSQVGLVFLMFAIGLGLSLTKLGRMGLPTLIATGLGAFFMLNLTQVLGVAIGWSSTQSLFIASMFLVSSSAVIGKVITELKLGHERFAQRALAITVLEDVVAVLMLTILATKASGGSSADEANMGSLLTTMSAFVVLLVGAGLLLLPRLLRRLETKADPELQTIIVAGVLFLLAISAAKAGYSLALGAFLLGAIVAEMPQKSGVEKAFAGMRDLFSSVFFVAIGMMIEVELLADVWLLVLGLTAFVLIVRPIATGLAMILVGTAPREARRAGLLLTPLGEFSFIIAQLGVGSAILPASFYPVAVGVSILTVLAMPMINRHAEPIVRLVERIEPVWLQRALAAYHGWISQIQERPSPAVAWKLVRGRLIQIVVELLLATGVMIFSGQILTRIQDTVVSTWLEDAIFNYTFWGIIGTFVLVLVVAIWRNVATVAMIAAESLGGASKLPEPVVRHGIKALAAVGLGYWLYAILPVYELPGWGWVVIAVAATAVVAVFSNRLIYWHSSWQSSVHEVFSEGHRSSVDVRSEARAAMDQNLEGWDIRLEECVVPDAASYAGQDLAQLAIPSRFGCSIVELERNGYVITSIGPELRLYPGDKLLLLGRNGELAASCEFLRGRIKSDESTDEFNGSVLETYTVPDGPRAGKSLAELEIARKTGVRVVGIRRAGAQIIAPKASHRLLPGDGVLVVGTLAELRSFRRWLKSTEADPVAPAAAGG